MAVRPVTPTKPTQVVGGWRNVLLGGRAINISNTFWKYNTRYSLDRHTGVDFSAGTGTPINAPLAGTVVSAGFDKAYGNTVLVKLANGDYMRFAHLSKMAVSKGQKINSGTYIGAVGSTGFSTGAHLHLEVLKASSGGRFGVNSFLDPVAYLNGIKTGAIREKPTTRGEPATSDLFTTPAAGSTISTNDPGVTGGGMGQMPGFKKKDFYNWLASKFGSIDTLLAMDKEARKELGGKSITWAINKMVKDKIVDPDIAMTYLNQTAWFKKYGVQTTERLVAERSRPGVFENEVANYRGSLSEALRGEGVTISEEALASIARNAYVYGWDDERAMQAIRESTSLNFDGRKSMLTAKWNELGLQVSEAAMQRLASASWIYGWTDETLMDEIQSLGDEDLKFSGGRIAAGIDEMTAFADDFGVTLTEADIRQYRNDFLDNLGDQRMRDALQERAAQTYAVFADKIRAGQSTRSLASAYFQRAAELLETDPESIKWDDPLFRGGRAFTGTDGKGQQVVKGLWDFEKEVRQDARWQATKNARDEVFATTGGILRTMGLI